MRIAPDEFTELSDPLVDLVTLVVRVEFAILRGHILPIEQVRIDGQISDESLRKETSCTRLQVHNFDNFVGCVHAARNTACPRQELLFKVSLSASRTIVAWHDLIHSDLAVSWLTRTARLSAAFVSHLSKAIGRSE